MALSALDDKAVEPTPAALAKVLGASRESWDHLISRMETSYGPVSLEWSFAGAKYGWTSKLRRKKRTILYLIPQEGSFLVGIVLGDRALGLLRRDEISADVIALIDEAPRYGEGTGFRVPVSSPEDCEDIEMIIEAKMA